MEKKVSIISLLLKRYPAGQYAVLSEVSDAAGYHRSGSCDHIAMSLWPSRGLGITGVEVKSFRSDWLREIKKPAKAENFFQFCNEWYLLITDDTVAKLVEVPPTWGLLCVKKNRLVVLKEAPYLKSKPLTSHFVAAMLKRATENMINVSAIEDKINSVKEVAIADTDRSRGYRMRELEAEHVQLKKVVEDFQNASGISIYHRWKHNDYGLRVGEVVKYILDEGGGLRIKENMMRMKETAERTIERIGMIINDLNDNEPIGITDQSTAADS